MPYSFPLLANCAPSGPTKRGFNLIEAAIVLGVIGLVIGGIWVVAAAMHEDYKVNKTAQDLLVIVRNVQSLISDVDSVAIGNTSISSTIINAGGFPQDWISGGGIRHPFGGQGYITNELSGSKGLFLIGLINIPPSACAKLIAKLTAISAITGNKNAGAWSPAASRRTNLARLWITSPSWSTDDFPVSPEAAAQRCGSVTSSSQIVLYYNYNRTN
jgi:hypothetical protein